MIQFEHEVCKYLGIPSIPKKEWDGKSSFKSGVGILPTSTGLETYCVVSFDSERDKEVRVVKVFSLEPFSHVTKVFVVPSYMDIDKVEEMDLDDKSKERVKEVIEEGDKVAKESKEEEERCKEYESLGEWVFPEIHTKEEAIAWLTSYRKSNKIRGKVPTNEDTLKAALLATYAKMKEKK